MPSSPYPDEVREMLPQVAALLKQAGIQGEFELGRIAGGRNNRVYWVTAAQRRLALKWYHRDGPGPPNRLAAELAFCEFCWAHHLCVVPRPLSADKTGQLALFQWIDGRRLADGELATPHIEAAVQFVLDLNRHRKTTLASSLPPAAEACFCVEDHLAHVDRRIERLLRIESRRTIDKQAIDFVRNQLAPRWQETRTAFVGSVRQAPYWTTADRCLSPSDFGFHNALLDAAGNLSFLDFEYAGWDDPAKLLCDFFCQIELPVDIGYWEPVVQAVAPISQQADHFADRCVELLPVYRIKWAGIVLNEFLPADGARRQFSSPEALSDQRLAEQLGKAQAILELV